MGTGVSNAKVTVAFESDLRPRESRPDMSFGESVLRSLQTCLLDRVPSRDRDIVSPQARSYGDHREPRLLGAPLRQHAACRP